MKKTKESIPVHCSFDEMWDIEKVIPNPRNPNTHAEAQVGLLAKIIQAQGWRAPITVSGTSGFIVRGHARLKAAQSLDLPEVPVDIQHYDNEAQEWADLIADNRIAELAEVDRPLLNDIIGELKLTDLDLDLTGYDSDAITKMMTEFLEPAEGQTDADSVPGSVETKVKPGDIWLLGEHRLMCGDSTVVTDVEKLMGGQKAKLIATDPP